MISTKGQSDACDLEIHIPISPTALFANRVHYLAASLAVHGGDLGNYRIIITVGSDEEPIDLHAHYPWSKEYPLEWRWMDRNLFETHSYFATRLKRFTYAFSSPVVLMLDADTIVTGRVDDLVAHAQAEQRFCGVVANASPVRDEFTWASLFSAAGFDEVPYVCEHTGYNCMFFDESKRLCPPYFNLGVLVSPSTFLAKVGEIIFSELEIVRKLENFFRAQMSLCLAMHRLSIPWQEMAFKYNFVNNTNYLKCFAEEFKDVRIIHYLDKQHVDKDTDFESPETINRLMRASSQDDVNARFIELLNPVHDRVLADLCR